MEKAKEFILKNKLIKKGDVIGVGVSGGSDSMALLYFLASLQDELDFEVVAIHINHGIRPESREEAEFVMEKCKLMGVRAYKFKIDAPKIAKEKGVSLETSAREGRYEIFKSLNQRGVVDKIALAHHQSDQAETILMHIFRGAGMSGARGMEPVRDNIYIRPILTVSKKEILNYCINNNIDYVEDKSNSDNVYNRNFIRNVILPQISERWPGAEASIISFAETIAEDDDFINKSVYDDAVLYDEGLARVPTSYFVYPNPVVNRLVIKVLKNMGITKDFEKKHVELVKELALKGENGTRLTLPFEMVVMKEYDYVTFVNKKVKKVEFSARFGGSEVKVPNVGRIVCRKCKTMKEKQGVLYIDYKKVPKEAVWRFREDGDRFTKFGGGTKKLKDYLIDRKIPARERDYLPVLAYGNEVLVIAGVEISENVKVEGSSVMSIEVKN